MSGSRKKRMLTRSGRSVDTSQRFDGPLVSAAAGPMVVDEQATPALDAAAAQLEDDGSDAELDHDDEKQVSLHDRLVARQARANHGDDARNPEWGAVNDAAQGFERGDKHEIDTAFGMARAHTGRGGGPMITTRAEEFDGASVGHTYPEMIAALKRSRLADAEIAQALLDEDGDKIPDGAASNAAAKLMAVTQFAEEARSASSGKYFRAVLRAVIQGKASLRAAIMDGYIPARDGGTAAMREWLVSVDAAELMAEVDDAALLSDDSDADDGA